MFDILILDGRVVDGGVDATMARLKDRKTRDQLRSWFAQPWIPLETVRLSFVSNPDSAHFEGRIVPEAAREAGKEVGDFICDLLLASEMAVGCVVRHTLRTHEDMCRMMKHPAHMAGSDGIFTGRYPHPRGWGCFARFLGQHVREEKTWSLETAVQHLSSHAARRFGLRDRGFILPGMAADVVVFDPETIADRSTYEDGRQVAVGMEHVLVNGKLVLHDGQRTEVLPGRPLRPRT